MPEPPKLFHWLETTYEAFWRLSRQRRQGFSGPDKLSVGDILDFFAVFDPLEDVESFYDLITAMDDLFIAETYKVIEQKRKASGG